MSAVEGVSDERDKRSPKSRAPSLWLLAVRKAAIASVAAGAPSTALTRGSPPPLCGGG